MKKSLKSISLETYSMRQLAVDTSSNQRVNKLLFWYSFFMAFPAIIVFQNISVFLFPFLLFTIYSLSGRFFRLQYGIQFIVLAFGVGAIASVWNIPENMPADSLTRALTVLPNYLYWVTLIVFLTSQKEWVNLTFIYKGIFFGILASIVYYFVLQRILLFISIFKFFSPNNFAFLLICYCPIVIWYTWKRFGSWWAFGLLLTITLSGFLSGSRSGSLLALSGGVFTLLLNRKNTWSIYIIAAVGYLVLILSMDTKAVKDVVYSLNSRTYDLIYNRKKTLEEDRSYLVRLAQIEKAVLIYEKHPWTGIGLNNFIQYKVKLPGNFEGAEFVVNKKSIDEKSAHNSYFGFLGEGGLLLLIPFVLILAYCILWFLFSVRKLLPEYRPIFVGIIHMSIHFYFIYASVNVFAWFLMGLGCWAIVKHKR